MDNLPICLVIGVDGKNPEVVIKGIIGHLPSVTKDEKGSFYQWDISNKYYNASINFCQITTQIVIDEDFSENVNAFIVFFNSLEENGLKNVEEWIPFVGNLNSEVKILVCEQCSTNENSKHTSKTSAQQWCIRHGFELIELDPLEKPDPDDEFPETLGFERIKQALHAHSWPNLQLKSGEKNRIDHLSRLLLNEDPDKNFDRSLFEAKSGTDMMVDRQISEGIDSFEELFQSLSLMKNQASTLEVADRKAYAEKMTMAFWQAIDGNPEEIQGLDSSEDEH